MFVNNKKGHVVEFCVAVFLFFNGTYILLFESCGAPRAIMMCLHAYLHIWCTARKGWSVFVKRRTAIMKLNALRVFDRDSFRDSLLRRRRIGAEAAAAAASGAAENEDDKVDGDDEAAFEREYANKANDVCAICFAPIVGHQSLLTDCFHIYHWVCLKKWLYLQDTCPMCHQLVYQPQAVTAR